MNRFYKGLGFLIVLSIMSMSHVFAADWGMIMLEATVAPTSNGSTTGTITGSGTVEGSWGSVTSNSNDTIITGTGTGGENNVTYNIANNDGYVLLYNNFDPSVDLTAYDSITIEVEGDVSDLQVVLANENTGHNNYVADVADWLPAGVDPTNVDPMMLVTIPFSAFRLQGNYGTPISLEDMLAAVDTIQLRVNADGNSNSGSFSYDDIALLQDLSAPVANIESISTADFVAMTGDTMYQGESYNVEVRVSDNGLVVAPGSDFAWIENPTTGEKIYVDPATITVEQNTGYSVVKGTITVDNTITGGFDFPVYVDSSKIQDLAGNAGVDANGQSPSLVAKVNVAESDSPVIDLANVAFSITGRPLQYGEALVVTVSVSDSTGIDGAVAPVVLLKDSTDTPQGTVAFNQLSYTDAGNGSYLWTGFTVVDMNLQPGSLTLEVGNVTDLFGNSVTASIVAPSLQGSVVNAPVAFSGFSINGQEVVSGDYVARDIQSIECLVDGGAFNIVSYNVTILDMSSTVVVDSGWQNVPGTVTTYNISYTNPISLAAGTYLAVVGVQDSTPTINTATYYFHVSGQKVTKVLAAPNPFSPNSDGLCYISYYLNADMNVEFRLYSISGELLYNVDIASGMNGGRDGYNEITWDGRNDFGETVANGVYLGYLIFNDDEVKKVKIAVLK